MTGPNETTKTRLMSASPPADLECSAGKAGGERTENSCCGASISGYVAAVDWQQAVSLGIVAATATILARPLLRRRKSSVARAMRCVCHSAAHATSASSIIYRARKGERPQVLVKLK